MLAATFAPGSALCELSVSVQPDSAGVDEGDDCLVGFYVGTDCTGLMGYDVIFSYDPAIVEIVSIEEGFLPAGSGHDTFFYPDTSETDSTVHVSGAILGAEVETPGYLFIVIFKGINAGKSYIDIEYSELRDDSNTSIPHSVERGVIVVVEAVPTKILSWGRLKAQYK
jgi:hypothetical protein